jgi:hypothetical protein
MAGTTINLLGISALDITGISSVSVSRGVVSFTIASSATPGGATGDIQYNNGGLFGGSAATINAAGTIALPVGQVLEFEGYGYTTAALSWLAADTLAIGNGAEGDVSGGLGLTALILFGSSAYSAYDLFHTTIMSGATMNWNLILPETPGASGQVLTTNGLGFTYWSSPAPTGVSWSSLTNATGNLTLSNAGFTTTFNQTSAVAWQWISTAAATSTVPQNSPSLGVSGAWWGGALATQTDSWVIQDQPSTSVTLASGLITHVAETAGSGVTLTLTSGGTTWPTGTWVTFRGFTTATWLNGVPVQIGTTSTTSIAFSDPTNHGLLASTVDTASGSAAVSFLNISQAVGSAPIGALRLSNPTVGTVSSVNASPELVFQSNYWTGAASAANAWTIGQSLLGGTNAQSNLSFLCTGGSGIAQISVTGNTPIVQLQNVNSTAPTSQFRFAGSAGTIWWGFGSHQFAAADTFEIFGGAASGISNAVLVFSAAGNCGIGIGNLTPTSTLSVFNAKATTGATQLLVQGGAVAADATTNNLFQINKGGTTIATLAVTGSGHVQAGTVAGTLNKDFAGQATVTAGATTIAVTFSSNHTGAAQPVIVITPTSDPIITGVPVGTWVTYSGSTGAWTGFTINISATLASNVTFNYLVVGQP